MAMLAATVDGVIGSTPTTGTLAAAALTPVGGLIAATQTTADAQGYRALLNFAQVQVPGRRCWAVEGAGSHGAGLACFLLECGERVVEICRPRRPASRTGAGDAIRAANQALALEHPAAPRQRGHREALRVLLATRRGAIAARLDASNQPRALIVGAPEELRAELRGLPTAKQIRCCATLRNRPARSLEHRATVRALRATAQRIQLLQAEADELHIEIAALVHAAAPWLPELPGVGPISAAQVLARLVACRAAALRGGVCGPGRGQSDPSLVWAAHPSPARTGPGIGSPDRAVHTITQGRLRDDPLTRAYAARRTAEGKTTREIRRCLKRFIAGSCSSCSNPVTSPAPRSFARLDAT